MTRGAALLALSLVAYAVVACSPPLQGPRWIGPGQNALAADMLGRGAVLPARCTWEGASLRPDHVASRYGCSGVAGVLTLDLWPRDTQPAPARRSQQFDLVVGPVGGFPPALLAALAAQIESREGQWRWSQDVRPRGRSVGWLVALANDAPEWRAQQVRRWCIAACRRAGRWAWLAPAGVAVLASVLAWRARRREAVAWSLAAAGVACACTLLLLPAPLAHADTSRDMLSAYDCVVGVACSEAGPPTSVPGLMQGTVWTRVLELARAAGVGVAALTAALRVLQAVAVGVMAYAAHGIARRAGGVAAAAVFLLAACTMTDPTILWNPTLMPLPLAVFAAATMRVAADGRWSAVALAAVALAVVVDLHVAAALWVPAFLAVVVASARRPLASLALAVGGVVVPYVVLSPQAAAVNALTAMQHPSVAVPALVVVGVGAALRARVGALAPEVRARWAVAALVAYGVAGMLLAKWLARRGLEARYQLLLAPFVALAAGVVAERLVRRAGAQVARVRPAWAGGGAAVATVALVAAMLSHSRTSPHQWQLAEIERLGAALYGAGYSYRDLHRYLRAVRGFDLVVGLSAVDPAARPSVGPARAMDDVLAVRVPAAAAHAAGFRAVAVGGSVVALTRELRPWVDRSAVEVCLEMRGAPGVPRCTSAAIDLAALASLRPLTFASRAYPTMVIVAADAGQQWDFAAGAVLAGRHTLQARVPPGAAPRVVQFLESPGETPWRIESVAGLAVDGALPARCVVLRGGAGSITFVRAGSANASDAGWRWPPDFVETELSDAATRAFLEGPARAVAPCPARAD